MRSVGHDEPLVHESCHSTCLTGPAQEPRRACMRGPADDVPRTLTATEQVARARPIQYERIDLEQRGIREVVLASHFTEYGSGRCAQLMACSICKLVLAGGDLAVKIEEKEAPTIVVDDLVRVLVHDSQVGCCKV